MMSKFTRSWALKGNDRHAPGPQPTNTTPVALTGSLNVDGRGGGLPPSADRPTYGQQQNGAGGQQPSKPSTAPTASSMASHGVDQIYRAGEQLLTNTAPKAGATANPSSYGGNGSYPSATPGPYDNQQFMTKHTDNEREVKGHDNNQMIRSPSMSTQSQRDKVLPRSKTKERTSAPADPPASGSPQYRTPQGGLDGMVVAYIVVPNKQVPWGAYNLNNELPSQDARLQRKESKTRDDKAQGGTTAGVQRAASKPRDEIRQTNIQTNGADSQQQAPGFDQQESNDPYNGMGARQVGNPAPSTSIPAPNEPSWVSMPSQKQNSRRLGVQKSNDPYNNIQTSSKDRAAIATQMDQVAPGGTPLTAPSQDRKSPVPEKKGGCCSIL